MHLYTQCLRFAPSLAAAKHLDASGGPAGSRHTYFKKTKQGIFADTFNKLFCLRQEKIG
jgi:hypothetical protein